MGYDQPSKENRQQIYEFIIVVPSCLNFGPSFELINVNDLGNDWFLCPEATN